MKPPKDKKSEKMKEEIMHGREWAVSKIPQFKRADGSQMKAFVLPGAFTGAGIQLMAEAGFERAESVSDCDVIVYMGGADISPDLYNDKNVASGGINVERDLREQIVYEEGVKLGKVHFGICRGAQLLAALNGCKLWQDVQGHAGPDHQIYDLDRDVLVTATSLHHQMIQDGKGLEIVAVTNKQISSRFKADGLTLTLGDKSDSSMAEVEIEAGAFHDTKVFFVQGHPEIGSDEYRSWTMTVLREFMTDWEEGSVSEKDEENQLPVSEQIQLWREAAAL